MVHEKKQKRKVKDPVLRKQEILNQAMLLFTKQGYENTSMRDIAKSLNISLGLCYRYFDSKQVLFTEAIEQYVQKCSDMFIHVFQNDNHDFLQKIKEMYQIMISENDIFAYHEFFHQLENEELHHELTMRICQKIVPIVTIELEKYCQMHHYHINQIETLVNFIIFGQIGILSSHDKDHQEDIDAILRYIKILIKHECNPE